MLIFLSLFIIILQILVFYLGVLVIGKLYTLGDEIRDNEKGQPFPQFHKTAGIKLLLVLEVFGLYWVLIFLNNFNDYVATAVALNHFFKDQYA